MSCRERREPKRREERTRNKWPREMDSKRSKKGKREKRNSGHSGREKQKHTLLIKSTTNCHNMSMTNRERETQWQSIRARGIFVDGHC